MRTDKQRIAKYKPKTDPATVRAKVAAMLDARTEEPIAELPVNSSQERAKRQVRRAKPKGKANRQ
jgi:hypothetical protein